VLRRTAALVYGRDGSAYVVAASNYGRRSRPDLARQHPGGCPVRLQVARRHLEAEARIVLPGDADYLACWR